MRAGALIGAAFAFGAASAASAAVEVGSHDFAFVSELAADGFETFPAGGSVGALFGMRKGAEMYLCFSADADDDAASRRDTIVSVIGGDLTNRVVPNIPVACIQTQ